MVWMQGRRSAQSGLLAPRMPERQTEHFARKENDADGPFLDALDKAWQLYRLLAEAQAQVAFLRTRGANGVAWHIHGAFRKVKLIPR